MEKIPKTVKIIVAVVIILYINYLLFAFVQGSMNPFLWDIEIRCCLVGTFILSIWLYGMSLI